MISTVAAAPFRPQDDAQVLERLPAGLRAPPAAAQQANPTLAAALAHIYIERSRAEADPRLLGYAQGVLMPWWSAANAPAEILLLRATIRQARHEFDAALRDLDAVIAQRPDSAQAWLTRATVLRVQGRYAEAAAACLHLHGVADIFVENLCSAAVHGLNGGLDDALQALTAMKSAAARQPPGVRAWFDAELAELDERAGRTVEAEAIHREALAQFPDDLGLRAAHADFLLDHARAQDALALVQNHERVDALRLRELLARVQLNQPHAEMEAAIAAGFEAAHLRNEDLHLREEARFVLEVKHDAPRALALAQRNWTVQHEPADARLLLVAAQAAQHPTAAQPVRDWLQGSHLQDARLTPYPAALP